MPKRTCNVPECERKHYARGWCGAHYKRWRINGEPGGPLPEYTRYKTRQDRFWAKADRSNPVGCWPWTGAKSSNGYGNVTVSGVQTPAHRVAYEMAIGPIPAGYEIDHVKSRGCTRVDCVNPAHLEAVTPAENKLRSDGLSARRARQTHCIRGHELTPENTYQHKGHRRCRACAPIRAGGSASAASAEFAPLAPIGNSASRREAG